MTEQYKTVAEEEPPRDGRTIRIKLDGEMRAFWCGDLKRWVLDQPTRLDSIRDNPNLRWRERRMDNAWNPKFPTEQTEAG